MSAGEALRAAVRQRLTAVLEEVLVLVQTAVGDYEDQLNRSKQHTERLRTRLLQLEPREVVPSNTEVHRKKTLQSNIKEEELDLWTVQDQDQPRRSGSGSKSGSGASDVPRSTLDTADKRDQHLQQHPELSPKHKSDDSDEECPICKQLDQNSRPASPGSGPDPNREDCSRPSETNNENMTEEFTDEDEDVKPTNQEATEELKEKTQEFESLEVKTEDNDEGYDCLNKITEISKSTDQEEAEASDLKRQAQNEEQPVVSKFRRRSPGRPEEMEESCPVTSSEEEMQLTTAAEGSSYDKTEKITSEPMEQEGPAEKQAQINDDGQSSAQTGASLETQNDSSSDPKRTNTEDSTNEVGLRVLKPGPTVKLVPLEFVKSSRSVHNLGPLHKSMNKTTNSEGFEKRNESQPGISSSPKRVLPTKTIEQSKDSETEDSEDEQMDKNSSREEGHQCKVSGSLQTSSPLLKSVNVTAKSYEFVERKAPKPKRLPQTNPKEQRKGASESEDVPFRRRLNRKAKTKATRSKRKKVNGESETDSGSDTDQYNDSDYKMENSTDSEDSEEDYHRIGVKKNSKNNLNEKQGGIQQLSNESERNAENSNHLKSNGGLTSGNGKSQETRDQPSTFSNCGPGSSEKTAVKRKNDGKHECPECGSIFKLKHNLSMHMVVHKEDRPFECSACDKTFKRKLNLQIHMSTHSGEKEFECSVCKKRFTRKCNLDDHLKTHTGEKPYSCSVCKSRFTCRSNLRRHTRSHTGQRPFDCDVCGKRFARKSILLEHMTSHTGEQAFSCSVCNKKFSRKHNLLVHSEIHREEKRFECSECGRRFCQKSQLQQHMVSHTGQKPFQCNVCKKSFTRKTYVKQHLEMYCLGAARDKTKKPAAEKEK